MLHQIEHDKLDFFSNTEGDLKLLDDIYDVLKGDRENVLQYMIELQKDLIIVTDRAAVKTNFDLNEDIHCVCQ